MVPAPTDMTPLELLQWREELIIIKDQLESGVIAHSDIDPDGLILFINNRLTDLGRCVVCGVKEPHTCYQVYNHGHREG